MVNVRKRGQDDSTDGRQEGAVADVNRQENDTHLSSLTASLPNPMYWLTSLNFFGLHINMVI